MSITDLSDDSLASASSIMPKQAPDDHRVTIPNDPGDLWSELFVENHRVCSRCCNRLRRSEPVPDRIGRDHSGLATFIYADLPDPRELDIGERQLHHGTFWEQPTLPGRRPKSYPPSRGVKVQLRGARYCSECGEFEPDTNVPTRTVDECLDVAANISQTLTEYGVRHDWFYLLQLTKMLKRSTVTNGDDHETFKRAIAESVKKAQGVA